MAFAVVSAAISSDTRLLFRETPPLYREILDQFIGDIDPQSREQLTRKRLYLLFKTLTFTARAVSVCTIAYQTTMRGRFLKSLDAREQEELKQKIINATKVLLTTQGIVLSADCLESIRRGKNPLTESEILKRIASMVISSLNFTNVNQSDIARAENVLTYGTSVSGAMFYVWNPRRLRERCYTTLVNLGYVSSRMARGTYFYACNPRRGIQDVTLCAQDVYYLTVDYFFPLCPLRRGIPYSSDIALLKDIDSFPDPIPPEHKRNRVFRQFTCALNPNINVRFPIVVLDSGGRLMEPISLFDKKSIIDYLKDPNNRNFYPETTTSIGIHLLREYRKIRLLIIKELDNLDEYLTDEEIEVLENEDSRIQEVVSVPNNAPNQNKG